MAMISSVERPLLDDKIVLDQVSGAGGVVAKGLVDGTYVSRKLDSEQRMSSPPMRKSNGRGCYQQHSEINPIQAYLHAPQYI